MFADRTNWNLDTNRLSRALAQYRASARPLLDLTASNPTECGFHYDAAAIRASLAAEAVLQYQPEPKGLPSARAAVAAYYAERSLAVSIDDICLGTSTSEAYSFVFRLLCNPGDEVLVPTPSYPLFDFLAEIQDVRPVRYPLIYDYRWQIDFHSLERAVTPRTRAIVLVNPNNPTGHYCSPSDAAKLNELCAAHRLALIADEVFLDFSLAPSAPPTSFAANSDALTFTMSGLSKIAGLPQMKAAWLVVSGPASLKSAALDRLDVIADTYLSMNAPVQHAFPVLLDQRHGFQRQLMARARKNLVELDRRLSLQKPCTRLDLGGGWYAVLRVPATRSDEDFAIQLLEARGVYVHPGHFYDFQSDGFVVVSLITPENEFAAGIERLLAMF